LIRQKKDQQATFSAQFCDKQNYLLKEKVERLQLFVRLAETTEQSKQKKQPKRIKQAFLKITNKANKKTHTVSKQTRKLTQCQSKQENSHNI